MAAMRHDSDERRPRETVSLASPSTQDNAGVFRTGTVLRPARRLLATAAVILTLLAGASREAARTMATITRAMGIPVEPFTPVVPPKAPGIVVDALLGTGCDRAVVGRQREAIEWMNACGAPIVSVDLPSGIDADTGQPHGCAVRAALTVTFVAPKAGFAAAGPWLGAVVVAGISYMALVLPIFQLFARVKGVAVV